MPRVRLLLLIRIIVATVAAVLAVFLLLQAVGADADALVHAVTLVTAIVLARYVSRRWRRQ